MIEQTTVTNHLLNCKSCSLPVTSWSRTLCSGWNHQTLAPEHLQWTRKFVCLNPHPPQDRKLLNISSASFPRNCWSTCSAATGNQILQAPASRVAPPWNEENTGKLCYGKLAQTPRSGLVGFPPKCFTKTIIPKKRTSVQLIVGSGMDLQ